MSRRGLILFAHGSRDPLWRAPIEAVRQALATLHPELPVRCAYLELCQPDLAQAATELIAAGACQISVTPMFLGTGRHAREDLPQLIAALAAQHPGVRFHVQGPVGEDPRMALLMAQIAAEDAL
ncbi:cobalamin biosynthesis protein CbiX [Acidovorax sp. HDW3]|uniref:sirohydrochlorin chelatase n=1 Tax=Acidovorax sp. HDW3 TaxID=2714923 RepID=UPI00140DC1BA|nr:CbiX/SirB N-terminal domain-containing protein [Acidovorax sp. HDW3]QIL43985.1 cobalamin biosynthesis protein CbiX [Acidovorax sp. HDW3]